MNPQEKVCRCQISRPCRPFNGASSANLSLSKLSLEPFSHAKCVMGSSTVLHEKHVVLPWQTPNERIEIIVQHDKITLSSNNDLKKGTNCFLRSKTSPYCTVKKKGSNKNRYRSKNHCNTPRSFMKRARMFFPFQPKKVYRRKGSKRTNTASTRNQEF